MRVLLRAEKGSTRAVAGRLGVSQRTVERYLAGQRKKPRQALREALNREVRKAWQTRARFGYTAPIGTTDDPRMRRLTVHLPPAYAARLFDAQQQGAADQRLRDIVAEGLQEVYSKDNGARAQGLEVALTDIDYFDVSY